MQKGSGAALYCLEDIKGEIDGLELQAKEQKMVEELRKETGNLNEMVFRMTANSQSKGTTASCAKRNREEDDDEFEERVSKVLRTYRKLKGTGEN
jgi:hypothetical protein